MRFVTKLTIGYEVMLGVTFLIAFLGWEGRQSIVSLQEAENRILKMQSLLTEMEKNVSLSHILANATYGQQVLAARGALSTALSEELQRTNQPEAIQRFQHLLKLEKEFYNSYLQLAGSTTSHGPANALQSLILISGEMHHELTTLLNEHQARQREITLEVDSWLIGGMLLAMILAGVAIILTMISFKRSVRSGILFIEDVEKGKLNTRVEYKSGDELGILLGSLQKMGEALLYAEQQHLRTHMSRIALSAMMETSMEPLTLNEQLTVILQIIQNIPWLQVKDKGAIFLTDERTGDLVLAVGMGLSHTLLEACQRVETGRCLCGQAKALGKIIHAIPGDEKNLFPADHVATLGRYCVPIFSRGKVLGVIMLLLDGDHIASPEEEALLSTIANTLAGIIERKRMEEQLQHMAHHDMLTCLPNRVLFMEHLDQALALTVRSRKKLAVMLIDLDRFKHVNDTFGHAVGDALLVQTAVRIKGCLRASDMVSRLGGDEFAVILQDVNDPADAGRVAEKIVKSLVEPFIISQHCCQIGSSVGIAFFPDHGNDPDTLLIHADEAMYGIKAGGRNGYGFYVPSA